MKEVALITFPARTGRTNVERCMKLSDLRSYILVAAIPTLVVVALAMVAVAGLLALSGS